MIVVGMGSGRSDQDDLVGGPWIDGPRDEFARWREAGADAVIVTARTTADIDALVDAPEPLVARPLGHGIRPRTWFVAPSAGMTAPTIPLRPAARADSTAASAAAGRCRSTSALCEECNPLGLKQPAATQVHAIAAGGIVLAVVLLAVLARVGLSGVGPFSGTITGVQARRRRLGRDAGGHEQGSKGAATTCRVVEAAGPVGGPGQIVQTPLRPGRADAHLHRDRHGVRSGPEGARRRLPVAVTRYAAELAFALEVAARAGGLLMDRYERVERIDYKSARDVVTEVDHLSEGLILDAIRAAFPGDALLAEETGEHDGSAAGQTATSGLGRVWVVDPLDGTINYANGIPFFCVSDRPRRGGPSGGRRGPRPGAARDRSRRPRTGRPRSTGTRSVPRTRSS